MPDVYCPTAVQLPPPSGRQATLARELERAPSGATVGCSRHLIPSQCSAQRVRSAAVYGRLRRNALAIGPALSAPVPPPSTSTAKARFPRYPMNQACDGGLRPVPYSAVPVFP